VAVSGEGFPKQLEEIRPSIDAAVRFAEAWPEAYRVSIVDVALRVIVSTGAPTGLAGREYRESATAAPPIEPVGSGLQRIANAAGLEVTDLRRVVVVDEDARTVRVIARVGGASTKERQNRCGALYAFLMEKAFGEMSVDVEDLRKLCREQACYDVNNFAANFAAEPYLNEMRGAKPKRYVPSKRGLDAAVTVLREIAEA
jgi:hypothetical protein